MRVTGLAGAKPRVELLLLNQQRVLNVIHEVRHQRGRSAFRVRRRARQAETSTISSDATNW